jgi:hypothetical protein
MTNSSSSTIFNYQLSADGPTELWRHVDGVVIPGIVALQLYDLRCPGDVDPPFAERFGITSFTPQLVHCRNCLLDPEVLFVVVCTTH